MIILLQLIITNALYCQVYFNERFNYSAYTNADIAKSALEHESGYYVAGMTGAYYIAVCNIDYQGKIKWSKTWGRPNEQHWLGNPGSFISTKDGGYAMCGTYKDAYVKDAALLIKFNAQMDTTWSKIYYDSTNNPPNKYRYFFQMKELVDGYICIGDRIFYDNTDYPKINMIRTDINGNIIFEKTYGNPGFAINQGHSIICTNDGGYAIGGFWYIPGSTTATGDPIVVKTDSLGNQEWFKNLGGPYMDNKAMLSLDQNGNIIVGTNYGDYMSGNDPYSRINIIKLDNNSNILWDKKYGTTMKYNYLLNIRTLSSGDIVATGTTPHTYPHIMGWILKVDTNGDSLWYREYNLLEGNQSMNLLYDVIETTDNGLLACGYIWPFSPDTGSQDAWVIKLDSIGCEYPFCDTTVGISEMTFADSDGFWVYPNPSQSFINFGLQVAGCKLQVGNYRLEIFDLFGRKVEEIVVPPWQETVQMDVSRWNAGVYVAVMWGEDGVIGREKFVVTH